MEDDFDEFFDTPRQKPPEKKSSKSSRTVDSECTVSEYSECDKDFGGPTGKPPVYPNSRTVSVASKQIVNGTSADDPQVHNSRRVIEAKVPCDSVKEDNEESYTDDSFDEEDDLEISGRRSPKPLTVNSDQCFVPKETSFSGYDSRPHEAKNSAQDLSDGSRSLTDDAADSDEDSEIIDVSPLNTPHSLSSTFTKNVLQSKSSDIPPVGLLNADRDSLDLDMLLQSVLHMEKQGRSQSRQSQAQLLVPPSSSRHNYSFSKERVDAIDKENHRLAARIMKHANDNKKAKAKVKKISTLDVGSKRPSSAAVNRAKQQQQIEAENLVNVFFTILECIMYMNWFVCCLTLYVVYPSYLY